MNTGRIGTLAIALVCGAAVTTSAQQELVGHWVLKGEFVSPTGPRVPFCGQECTITQIGKSLTVKTSDGSTATYDVGGPPTKTRVTSSGYTADVVASARWEKGTLIVTRKTIAGKSEVEVTHRISVRDSQLTVEGSAGRGQGKFIYTMAK
jgi:hypothetical protein